MIKKLKKELLFAIGLVLVCGSGVAQVPHPAKLNTANKELLLRIVENLFNKGDTSYADKYFVPEFASEEKAFTRQIRAAFPDLVISVDILVAEGDLVAARWVATGTQRGPFLGVAATNKKVSWKGSWFWTIRNGIVTDGMGKGSWDALGLIRQLQSKSE